MKIISKVEVSVGEYKAHHINRIKAEYDSLRSRSKSCSFALQYQGTAITLVNNSGFTQEGAEQIVTNYHTAYAQSLAYAQAKIDQASRDGYVTLAFGLRLRTPLLKQVILGNRQTPFAAEAEGRTAGNALSQSYGLLNSKAGNDVMTKVRASKFAHDIRPAAHIHDAQYYFVRDNLEALKFLNDIVGEAMSWQDMPEIAHDQVHLSGELDIFYPTWKDATNLPNFATEAEIVQLCKLESIRRKEKLNAKAA